MRVLVTGNEGLIGSRVASTLSKAGHKVVGFDLLSGPDVLDSGAVRTAAQGCQAIVHLAALVDTSSEAGHDVVAVNLLGTWNVLSAAVEAGVERVVFYSSVNALGVFKGERAPDYLPLDDDHPCYPSSPYGISKRLAEEMCRHFTEVTGISTICLRPPGVFAEATYQRIRSRREANPEFEWTPYWEYGAFLDVRDAAEAARCALRCANPGHVTVLLCAADISSSGKTSRELVQAIHPDVPWRGGREFEREPYRALLETRRARDILGWTPRYTWRQSRR